jgi:hypothetical protein
MFRALGSSNAGLLAHVAFWIVLAIGLAIGELWTRRAAVFVLLWMFGVLVLPRFGAMWGVLVIPYVALLDIVLVLVVFKGDVHLS